jgi:hypothetical protein
VFPKWVSLDISARCDLSKEGLRNVNYNQVQKSVFSDLGIFKSKSLAANVPRVKIDDASARRQVF